MDAMESHANTLNDNVKSMKLELKNNVESDATFLGVVYDSVKERAEVNRTVINNNRKSIEVYSRTKTIQKQDG